MLKKIESSKDLFIVTTFFTVLFYILAHGHRFTNSMFSGDSLYMIYQNDSAWEIALGRFMHPILVLMRGAVESPFLISVISVTFFSLSAYFVVDFLEIKRLLSIVFVTAVMTCNTTVLATNATFLTYADFYVIALFFAVFGVWLMKKGKPLYLILGAVSLSLSLGTYQAYLCVAIAMVMVHFIFNMMDRPAFKSAFLSVAKYLVTFMVSAIIYYGMWKLFQKVFNIWTANTYNGMASIGDFAISSIGDIIGTTYIKVWKYFINPETFLTMPFRGESLSIIWVYLIRFCNLAVVAMLVLALIVKNIRCKTDLWHRIIQILIVALFPFGINFVCFISQGMQHTLMIYAFCFVYILAIKAGESILKESVEPVDIRKILSPWLVVLASLVIVTWSNIVYSNQVYLKKDLQDKAALSLMTRIVYKIESMENYVAGETPVAFYGSFESDTSYIKDLEVFEAIRPYGMGKSPLTYVSTDYAYLTYILNVNMNLTRISDEKGIVKQMPNYPAEGSVAYVDGTIVVKISDVE